MIEWSVVSQIATSKEECFHEAYKTFEAHSMDTYKSLDRFCNEIYPKSIGLENPVEIDCVGESKIEQISDATEQS